MNTCVLTAASEKYLTSLQGLISSIRLNWSDEIVIVVYDLGLKPESRQSLLQSGRVIIEEVPEFCPHWRKYYTWKLWIMANADYDCCLWLDAGVFVLKPLDGVMEVIKMRGLFFVPNYQSLGVEAPHAAVYGLGLTYAELEDHSSISANIIGFNRYHASFEVIKKSFELGLEETNLRATTPRHRWDQALISCVLYATYPNFVLFDGQSFAGWTSPTQVPGQMCWGQRRAILQQDVKNFWIQRGACNTAWPRDPSRYTPLSRKLFNWAKAQAARVLKRKGHDGVR